MFIVDLKNEVVEEGKPMTFKFKGKQYKAYQRKYGDDSIDVEVQDLMAIGADVTDDVQDYAETLFEGIDFSTGQFKQ